MNNKNFQEASMGLRIAYQNYLATIVEASGQEQLKQHVKDTANRHVVFLDLMSARYVDPEGTLKALQESTKVFEATNDGAVSTTGKYYSLCAHHLIPFFGTYKITYIPNKHIVGLSKIKRIINYYSAGFNVQENLTSDVGEYIFGLLQPKSLKVELVGSHLCEHMRGVRNEHGEMTTVFHKEA